MPNLLTHFNKGNGGTKMKGGGGGEPNINTIYNTVLEPMNEPGRTYFTFYIRVAEELCDLSFGGLPGQTPHAHNEVFIRHN